jgi:hypothetical protein
LCCLQAQFYDKAIFRKLSDVATTMADIANDIDAAVSPFIDTLSDILEEIEKGTAVQQYSSLGKVAHMQQLTK